MPRFSRRGRGAPRFGRPTRAAIKEIELHRTGKNGKCDGCGLVIALGELYLQLRTQSWARSIPCSTCNQIPAKMKRYHIACKPGDINKAMGYDPAAHQHSSGMAPGYVPPATHTVAPPPKPKSSKELQVEGLLVLEGALAAAFREGSINKKDPLVEKAVGTLNGIKARIIKPGSQGEQDAAINVALKKIIDLVFAGNRNPSTN